MEIFFGTSTSAFSVWKIQNGCRCHGNQKHYFWKCINSRIIMIQSLWNFMGIIFGTLRCAFSVWETRNGPPLPWKLKTCDYWKCLNFHIIMIQSLWNLMEKFFGTSRCTFSVWKIENGHHCHGNWKCDYFKCSNSLKLYIQILWNFIRIIDNMCLNSIIIKFCA